MKKLIILMCAFAVLSLPAFCQKNVPENVNKEFAKKYPSAQAIRWASEESNEWEAEFKINGKEMSASYDNKGIWLESETEISAIDLPAAITTILTKEFAGYKTGEMSAIENPKMKGFELILIKGGTSLEVIFDNSGKVRKKTEVKKEK